MRQHCSVDLIKQIKHYKSAVVNLKFAVPGKIIAIAGVIPLSSVVWRLVKFALEGATTLLRKLLLLV